MPRKTFLINFAVTFINMIMLVVMIFHPHVDGPSMIPIYMIMPDGQPRSFKGLGSAIDKRAYYIGFDGSHTLVRSRLLDEFDPDVLLDASINSHEIE